MMSASMLCYEYFNAAKVFLILVVGKCWLMFVSVAAIDEINDGHIGVLPAAIAAY